MNLEEVRERIDGDNEGKWDNLLDTQEMLFCNGRLTFPRLYRADNPKGLALTKWATAQMCQRLNIPTTYFRRCPASLQDMQVNHWLRETDTHREPDGRNNGGNGNSGGNGNHRQNGRDRWLLRAKGDVLRGVLTERYTRLDNADLLAALLPSLDARLEVGWFAITDESLHLRLLDPALARDVLPNDRLVAGLHISNSEVGKRSVTVDALVYRLVCANGLIRLVKGKSLLHRRHVALTTANLELALKGAVRNALVQSTGFMERLSWATEQPVADVPATLDAIAQEWGLSQALRGRVQESIVALPRHQHETLYGLVNGLTGAAQTLEADERYTLETLAGRLLETGPPRPKAKESRESDRRNGQDNSPLQTLSYPTGMATAIGEEEGRGDRDEELSLFAGEIFTSQGKGHEDRTCQNVR